ncbi:OsmC family protein [Kaarinaea lacus]
MSMREFQFRLSADYDSPDNKVAGLLFEYQVNNEWQVYDPTNYAAGFLVLLYAILNCQHTYFRANATERGLQLQSAKAILEVTANNDWEIKKLRIHVDGQLAAGKPTDDDKIYIVERMSHCPVSVNLATIADAQTTIQFTH